MNEYGRMGGSNIESAPTLGGNLIPDGSFEDTSKFDVVNQIVQYLEEVQKDPETDEYPKEDIFNPVEIIQPPLPIGEVIEEDFLLLRQGTVQFVDCLVMVRRSVPFCLCLCIHRLFSLPNHQAQPALT